jgi:hypothetical protein
MILSINNFGINNYILKEAKVIKLVFGTFNNMFKLIYDETNINKDYLE